MERMTFEGNFCDIAQCRELPCPYNGACSQRKVWEQLKAYEDTGLTPEEVLPKDADKYYKPGKHELDWYNSADRIAMVKDCGFTCIPDAHCAEECADCPAKEFCDDFIEMEDYDG